MHKIIYILCKKKNRKCTIVKISDNNITDNFAIYIKLIFNSVILPSNKLKCTIST